MFKLKLIKDNQDQNSNVVYAGKQILETLNQNEFQFYIDAELQSNGKKMLTRIIILNDHDQDTILVQKKVLVFFNFVKKIDIIPQDLQIIPYQEASELNMFPDLQIAKQLHLSLIMTKNSLKYLNKIKQINLESFLNSFVFYNEMQIEINTSINEYQFEKKIKINLKFQIISDDDYYIYQKGVTQIVLSNINCNNFTEQYHNIPKYFKNYIKDYQNINFEINYETLLMVGSEGSGKRNYLKYIQKDQEQVQNMDQIWKVIIKGIAIQPSIIHLRNINFREFQEQDLKKYIQIVLNRFYQLKEKQLVQKIILVFSCKSIDKQDLQNIKNLFDKTIQFNNLKDDKLKNFINFIANEEQINMENFEQQESKGVFNIVKQLKKNQQKEEKQNNQLSFQDVGGLQQAKSEIIKTILMPQIFPQIFTQQLKPRTGLLFYGPPGTGKTLLARCIASQTKMSFISIKGPELLNMYIGESEKNIRNIFQKARDQSPAILFFDELDSLIPARGQSQDSSNVMDRIVAQFLTEIDQIDLQNQVFVIGATNRPDLLDQSLLRPGRFDKMVYLGISEDSVVRQQILQSQLRKFNYSFEIKEVEKLIGLNYSGADFYGIVQNAIMICVKRKIEFLNQQVENGQSIRNYIENNQEMSNIIITLEDMIQSIKNSVPSVSINEIEKYKQLQNQFQ